MFNAGSGRAVSACLRDKKVHTDLGPRDDSDARASRARARVGRGERRASVAVARTMGNVII